MSTLFNLIDWLRDNNSTTDDMPVGDLFEHRVGYPVAQILLDSTPPVGEVVINENLSSGGIKIHEFSIFGDGDIKLSPARYVIEDRYGSYLTAVESTDFGGSSDESKYQLIGYADNHSVSALFTGTETIKAIQVGATASKAKQYILEIQIIGTDKWLPIFMMIASQETHEFCRYDFAGDDGVAKVKAIRIRYKGDYFASINTGNNITLAAFDNLTSLTAAQISHYADFSDSTSFPGTDENGWLSVSDGTNIFSWELVNNSKLWAEQSIDSGTTLESLNTILLLNNTLVAIGNTSTYILSFSTNEMSTGYTFAETITCAISDGDSKLYIGLSNGKIYKSSDGTNFAFVTDVSVPVTAMINYQNILYIGTDQSDSENTSAIIYTWDGTSLVNKYRLDAPIVSCFTKVSGYLFIGTSGSSSSNLGYVYRFNGNSEWSLSFRTGSDEVQALTYSLINQKLWCAVNKGKIYTASFNTSGIPLWNNTAFYQNDSESFYSMVTTEKQTASVLYAPPVNSYVWICSNTDLIAYVNSAMKKQEYISGNWQTVDATIVKFETIQSPGGGIINGVAYYGGELYGACTDGKIYKFDLSVVSSTTRNVYIRLKDKAGNISSLPSADDFTSIYDTIVQDTDRNSDGTRISDGHIYQVKYKPGDNAVDQKVVSLYAPNQEAGAILSPDRRVRSLGYYISPPFYVANLTNWDLITFLYNFPECTPDIDEGLDYGVSIDLYVKTANTRALLLSESWGTAHSVTTINVSQTAQSMVEASFEINSLQGRWIQFYTVLTTASQAKTPDLLNVSLFYKSSGSSYFFTSMIDTAKQIANYRNYIMNSDFEIGVWPWTVTGSNLQILTTTNTAGLRIGLISRTAGTIDADYITSSFLIESDYASKSFIVSFWYQTTEDYVDDLMVVRIRNNTTSSNTDFYIKADTDGRIFKEYFVIPSGSSDFSYSILFVLSSGADAFDISIDDIYVGPDYGSLSEDPAKFYRGLLTANTTISNGDVVFAYTTEDGDSTFDFNNSYTEIEPNRVFELDTPSSKIRFGILFTKTGTDPIVVHDFAVQLDAHDTDMKLMGLPQI